MQWETTEIGVFVRLCVTLGCSLPLSGPCCWRVSEETGAAEAGLLSWEGHKAGGAVSWSLASPCVFPGNAAPTSPGNLSEMQTLGPYPDLLNQSLNFNMSPEDSHACLRSV